MTNNGQLRRSGSSDKIFLPFAIPLLDNGLFGVPLLNIYSIGAPLLDISSFGVPKVINIFGFLEWQRKKRLKNLRPNAQITNIQV